MNYLWFVPAIVLTVYLVVGALDHDRGRPIWTRHYMTTATMLVGGGIYGLGIFDAGLLPQWSWYNMALVIGCSWVWVWAIRRNRVMQRDEERKGDTE